MERKLIESIINGIVRQDRDNITLVLDGIALLLCRNNRHDIRSHLSNKEFDFENLFVDGTYVVKHIQNSVPKEQLNLLYENFALTAEVLLDYVQTRVPRFFEQQGSVNENVSRLMMHFLKPQDGDFVYNPFGGDYYAPIDYPGTRFLSEVIYPKESRYLQLVMAAKWQDNVLSRPSNPFMRPEDEKEHFNLIYIPSLPFGIRIAGMGRKIEEDFILRMMKILVPGGRMVVVLPSVALSADIYFELRKTLAESRYLRDVILFSQNTVYHNTGIKTVAFVIEKRPASSNCFNLVDTTAYNFESDSDFFKLFDRAKALDHEVVTQVTFDSIFRTSNCQIINPKVKGERIARPGYKYVKLKDVLSSYSKTVELDGSEMVPRLSGKNMHEELPSYAIDVQDVEIIDARGRFTAITEPVFCFHGITRNCVWCIAEPDLPIYCNGDVYTFRITSDIITPEYLCFILQEEDIAADIKSRVSGNTIPRISRSAFLDVEIPIPDNEVQAVVVQEMAHYLSDRKSRLAKKEKEAHQETLEDIKDDIEDKIHLMGPYNLDIQTGINRLLKKLNNGETLRSDSRIFKDSDITLGNYLSTILEKSKSAGYITASIGGSIFESVGAPMDSFVYLQEYVAYLQNDDAYEGIEFKLGPIKAPYALMITPRSLRLVLDTIVRNAVMHGFSDDFYGEKKIWINIEEDFESGMAVISVANNGLKVSEDFSEDLYERKFGKCGETAHTGRGGYFVSNAMRFYKGSVSVETSNPEWPFIVKLHIPMSHE